MDDEDSARAQRAAQRAGMLKVRVFAEHPGHEHDLSPVKGAEALALAAELSRVAWLLAGNEMPTYTRGNLPVRLSKR